MAALVRRLQEYERFSEAANQLDDRPRLERDIDRADANKHMFVSRDTLSLRERMTNILQLLQEKEYLSFGELFTVAEGRLGVVVSFIFTLSERLNL